MRKTKFLVAVATAVFTCLSVAAPVRAQVFLDILNEIPPGYDQIIVEQGIPVEVVFEVLPSDVITSPDDLIQLRRVEDSSIVDQEVRRETPIGTVFLDTSPENAIGVLEVAYVYSGTGEVLAVSEETVTVIDASPPEAPTSMVVPDEAETIQEAVNIVADGGTVFLKSGTFEEKIVIAGKQVNLIGSGSKKKKRRTEIVDPAPVIIKPLSEMQGLVTYTEGGGGLIKDIAFKRGDVAVLGVEDGGGLPAPIRVEDVVVQEGALGIAGSFSKLTVKDVDVKQALAGGIIITKINEALELIDDYISDIDGVGILIFNIWPGPGHIDIVDQGIYLFSQGGIVVVGSEKHVNIANCEIGYGRVSGILLLQAGSVAITDTHVHNIKGGGPLYLGDGLTVSSSDFVIVIDCTFTDCERAGILFAESDGLILDTVSAENRFGIAFTEEGPWPYYDNPSNTYSGWEKDILQDPGNDLPVPDEPPPLPEP